MLPGLGGGFSRGREKGKVTHKTRSWPLGVRMLLKDVGPVAEYLVTLRSSWVPQGKALPQTSEFLVPTYSHIRSFPGMAMGSRWHQ